MTEIKAKYLKGFCQKLLGLHAPNIDGAVYFKTKYGIHTFFMKKKIQVIVLSQKMHVISSKIIEPNQIYFWNTKYKDIIEIPISDHHQELDVTIGEEILLTLL